MLKKTDVLEVYLSQTERLILSDKGCEREILSKLDLNTHNHALIISGIRRCGKSTLLHQLIAKRLEKIFYINFDTPKLFNFELIDFEYVDELIKENNCKLLFFDEIQVVDGWELFIRQKLDEGFQVFITGSNASLLSQELGTKLTGRHITKELFPFSFTEFCSFKELKYDRAALNEYLNSGGFPEYVRTLNPDLNASLIDDILYRDIAVRHNIRDIKSLKRLLVFLATNVGNLVSANKLTQTIGIKSSATILEYFSFYEQAYLLQLIPKFSYSYKVQLVNPRKIYFIDNGLLSILSNSFSNDIGHRFENLIFWELRRNFKEIYYFNESTKECDFVVCEKNIPKLLIQVCYVLTNENQQREIEGLIEAMNYLNFDTATIVSFDQEDLIIQHAKRINVVPAYKYLSEFSYNSTSLRL